MLFSLRRGFGLLALVFLASACAPSTHYYLKVEQRLSQQDFLGADGLIEEREDRYGSRNTLLYLMDRATTLHYAGRHEESNEHLARAERLAEELYTKSITGELGALLTNDNTLPYEGEDFEQVMIHLISALNYAYLGQWDEALVEARKVDHKLNLLNDRYEKKNLYKDDAFARYLSALLYEARGETNDAWIAYRKAYEAYLDYEVQYGTPLPQALKSDLLRITKALGLGEEHQEYKKQFGEVDWVSPRDYRRYGEIILISYSGLSPVKESYQLAVPVPDGLGGTYIATLAMPRFISRSADIQYALLLAHSEKSEFTEKSLLVENITAIAEKNLEDRIGRITLKAAARAAAKYLISQKIRKEVEDNGEAARVLADLGTNLFSILTEQADTRSWRTLPGQVQMTRLLLPPGTYDLEARYLSAEGQELGREVFGVVSVKASEKKFLGHRVLGAYHFIEDIDQGHIQKEPLAEACGKGESSLCE